MSNQKLQFNVYMESVQGTLVASFAIEGDARNYAKGNYTTKYPYFVEDTETGAIEVFEDK